MDTYTIAKIIFGFISTISISGGVLWFFTKKASELLAERYKQQVSHDFEKKLEAYKIELDVLKATTLKFNDKQFELYLDLWKRLQELKFACNELWDVANRFNLQNFARALKNTSNQIEISSILIEDKHYNELQRIINNFKEYDIGKKKLIQFRDLNNRDRNNIAIVDDQTIQNQIDNMINRNGQLKDDCIKIIEEMKSSIQTLIKGNKN